MKTSKAYSPGHITGFFKIDDSSNNPLFKGSTGSGFSIKKGVTTYLSIDENLSAPIIEINNIKENSPEVSTEVINIYKTKFNIISLDKAHIKHEIQIPMGCGFGTSGAGALSLSLAINKHFNIGLDFIKAAQIAHTAEINCRTGLGTVIGECYGNFECRVKAGAPGIGKVINYGKDQKNIISVFIVFGPYSTKTALSDEKIIESINIFGNQAIKGIIYNPDYFNFMNLSETFSRNTSLLTNETRNIMKYLNQNNFKASMLMFGNGLFTIIKKQNYDKLIGLLIEYLKQNEIYFKLEPEQYNFEDQQAIIFSSDIAETGGHVIYEI